MKPVERNLGTQPLDALMAERNLSTHQIVAASAESITHKMVSRARKGRWLTRHVQQKILRAYNRASEEKRELNDLFTY